MTTTAMIEAKQTQKQSIIERDAFPFEFLSTLAERESWRKEVYRPVYHIHKWWANRLGSIFRGILLGCLLPENADLAEHFYQPTTVSPVSVFDPFMGSGTTVGEAHKLGCIALGRDINPVACESVRVALRNIEPDMLERAFSYLSSTVGERIRELYSAEDSAGERCDVLYYFWVKQLPCPHCATDVDLFSSYVFARNAYPDRKPVVQVLCPRCGDVFPGLHGETATTCPTCAYAFNPTIGPASGTQATCPACTHSFHISKVVRQYGKPPKHRLYAKLLLTSLGEKQYLLATETDIRQYEASAQLLHEEVAQGAVQLPEATLTDGFNTRQAIGYNYRTWRDFFNERQLLALGWLQEAIRELPDTDIRDALLVLFSGVLEFNNLFASYKGEGTGAVRHMFAHHILKPERVPIEANVWGTSKSSGSFSNLFKSRLLRAVDYRIAPFEVGANGSAKVFLKQSAFAGTVEEWMVKGEFKPRGIYLSCGSSDATALPDRCIDFIVTDPPFFDNVHYSELADFFNAWQSLVPRGFISGVQTTRDSREVQDTDADCFAAKLRAVFSECKRVLRDDGLLIFTYHHSRSEGWTSLVEAVVGSGFSFVNAHPVKAEMSIAMPKMQAKEPIQLDIIIVCRKREQDRRSSFEPSVAFMQAEERSKEKLERLIEAGFTLSLNDRRITVISQFLAALGPVESPTTAIDALRRQQENLERLAGSYASVTVNRSTGKTTAQTAFTLI